MRVFAASDDLPSKELLVACLPWRRSVTVRQTRQSYCALCILRLLVGLSPINYYYLKISFGGRVQGRCSAANEHNCRLSTSQSSTLLSLAMFGDLSFCKEEFVSGSGVARSENCLRVYLKSFGRRLLAQVQVRSSKTSLLGKVKGWRLRTSTKSRRVSFSTNRRNDGVSTNFQSRFRKSLR